IATAVAWVILAMLKPLERRFALRKTLPQVRLRFAGRASLAAVEQVLMGRELAASTVVTRRIPDDGDEVTVEFARSFERAALGRLADPRRALAGGKGVSPDVSSRASGCGAST